MNKIEKVRSFLVKKFKMSNIEKLRDLLIKKKIAILKSIKSKNDTTELLNNYIPVLKDDDKDCQQLITIIVIIKLLDLTSMEYSEDLDILIPEIIYGVTEQDKIKYFKIYNINTKSGILRHYKYHVIYFEKDELKKLEEIYNLQKQIQNIEYFKSLPLISYL